jgi:hypothetical protein
MPFSFGFQVFTFGLGGFGLCQWRLEAFPRSFAGQACQLIGNPRKVKNSSMVPLSKTQATQDSRIIDSFRETLRLQRETNSLTTAL